MIDIKMQIFLHGGKTWDETASENPPLPATLFNGIPAVDGAIRIFENGVLSIELEDELPALIKNLCFTGSRELQQQGHTTYNFHSYPAHINLLKQDDKILLSGTDIDTKIYDAQELLTGLYQCGEHFMELLHDFKKTNGETAPLLSLIDILEAAKLPEQQ